MTMGDVKPYDAEELAEVRGAITADLEAARGLLQECSEALSALEPIAVYDYLHEDGPRDAKAKALLDRLRAVLARIDTIAPAAEEQTSEAGETAIPVQRPEMGSGELSTPGGGSEEPGTIPTPEHSGHHTTCQRCNAPATASAPGQIAPAEGERWGVWCSRGQGTRAEADREVEQRQGIGWKYEARPLSPIPRTVQARNGGG